jgi:S-adenosylmethionine:tRNA ribosyltransferase-isomerase
VAAPTAGLHFTPALLEALRARGVERADVTLEVGVGTFRPVETEFVEDHPIHAEWCGITREVRERLARTEPGAQATGSRSLGLGDPKRVICVGTTAARTVETYAALPDCPARVSTRLLITPGYRWRWVDGLLTNFHLPRSSLMAMVAALLPEGVPRLKSLYAEAIALGYRFYSYGDAMLFLP